MNRIMNICGQQRVTHEQAKYRIWARMPVCSSSSVWLTSKQNTGSEHAYTVYMHVCSSSILLKINQRYVFEYIVSENDFANPVNWLSRTGLAYAILVHSTGSGLFYWTLLLPNYCYNIASQTLKLNLNCGAWAMANVIFAFWKFIRNNIITNKSNGIIWYRIIIN